MFLAPSRVNWSAAESGNAATLPLPGDLISRLGQRIVALPDESGGGN